MSSTRADSKSVELEQTVFGDSTGSVVFRARKFLLFGDSITQFSFSPQNQGFGAALADWYQRTLTIINHGYSGYNTEWITTALHYIFPLTGQDSTDNVIATVFFGANDGSPHGLQHVPLEKYTQNLIGIIQHLRHLNPDIAIILITPPPVDNTVWTRSPRDRAVVLEYARAVIEIARQQGTAVLNLWGRDLEDGNDAYKIENGDLIDGLHLAASGNKKVFEGLKNVVLTTFPALAPVKEDGSPNLPSVLPSFFTFMGNSEEEIKAKIRASFI